MGRSGDPRRRAAAAAFVGLGTYAEATPTRQRSGVARLAEESADALAAGRHYWTALAQFKLSEDDAQVVAGVAAGPARGPNLDTENLLNIETGCFVCEQPLTPALLGTRCPGEPEGSYT